MATIKLSNLYGAGELSLSPGSGYKDKGIKKDVYHRAIDGKLYNYKFYHKRSWAVPLDAISKADADLLNNTWISPPALPIVFYPDLINEPLVTLNVRMVNREAPMQEWHLGYWKDMFFGTIELEEV